MSEYMEKHAVSRLVGPPPGYMGYEEVVNLQKQLDVLLILLILFDE